MIVIEARPSTNDDAAHTIKLSEPASTPASSPATPSTLIHSSDTHESSRARLASRYQAPLRLGGCADSPRRGSGVPAVVAMARSYGSGRPATSPWLAAAIAAAIRPSRS